MTAEQTAAVPDRARPHHGRVAVVINAKAGTARTADRGQLTEMLKAAVAGIGDLADLAFVEPKAWTSTLTRLADHPDIDTVIVGGGDGSVSAAGTIFAGTGKVMGVIPLGTFNLFARSLRIPVGFDAAVAALPDLAVKAVDVGELTDGGGTTDLFLHHLSIGFHPRFIEIRDAMPYGSRWGKILASLKVWRRSVRSLRRLTLTIRGDVERPAQRYYQAAVTVGSFREGFGDFPHAEDLTKGDLDLVLLPARSRWDFLVAMVLVAIGRWRSNSRLLVDAVRNVEVDGSRRSYRVSCDGEVSRRRMPLSVRVRPKALKVLMMPPAVENPAIPSD